MSDRPFAHTIDSATAPYAALLLRVCMGVMFLAHDALKLFVFGPAGTVRFFGTLGLPPAVAYLAIALELVGGIALILGVWARLVALVLIPHLLATIWFVHGVKGWVFSAPGGGWEFPRFLGRCAAGAGAPRRRCPRACADAAAGPHGARPADAGRGLTRSVGGLGRRGRVR